MAKSPILSLGYQDIQEGNTLIFLKFHGKLHVSRDSIMVDHKIINLLLSMQPF